MFGAVLTFAAGVPSLGIPVIENPLFLTAEVLGNSELASWFEKALGQPAGRLQFTLADWFVVTDAAGIRITARSHSFLPTGIKCTLEFAANALDEIALSLQAVSLGSVTIADIRSVGFWPAGPAAAWEAAVSTAFPVCVVQFFSAKEVATLTVDAPIPWTVPIGTQNASFGTATYEQVRI